MNIIYLNPNEIFPYEKNPRKNDMAVDKVAQSIKEFGFKQPIVIDKNKTIIVGHTRWKAALKLNLDKVPVLLADDLTKEKARAYRIADNKTNEFADWDNDLLRGELFELRGLDFDLEMLGFSNEELEKILGVMGTEGLTDPDVVPEPPDEPITRPGNLWALGNHRLLCGDSSKPDDVDRLLGGVTIHMVNTDPPYNVRVAPRSNNALALARTSGNFIGQQAMDAVIRGKVHATSKKLRPKDRPLANDFISDEEFERLLLTWFGNISRVLKPGGSFYIWGGFANTKNYRIALEKCNLHFSQTIIWVKEHPVLTRKDFLCNHEWCFYGWKEGARHYFNPEIKNATDVWNVKSMNNQDKVHLTEKPVELAVRSMTYSSKQGENILDLFGGSGSTLIAAEKTGRHAFLMELDALYCDVIIKRWEDFTGKKAELIND